MTKFHDDEEVKFYAFAEHGEFSGWIEAQDRKELRQKAMDAMTDQAIDDGACGFIEGKIIVLEVKDGNSEGDNFAEIEQMLYKGLYEDACNHWAAMETEMDLWIDVDPIELEPDPNVRYGVPARL